MDAGSRKLEAGTWNITFQPPASSLRGFTLVELLVTTALVALVGATVVAAVTGCLRVWSKVDARGTAEAWTELAFVSLRKDLANVHPFSPVLFEGAYDALSIPSLVEAPAGERASGEAQREPGQTTYFYSGRDKALCRSQQAYRALRHASLRERCHAILTGIDRARFSYYAPASDTTEAGWISSWSAPEPPLAVAVEVRYDERMGGHARTERLLVHVPFSPPR
ncbi:MAG: prepilin-type N-terminal cleavage/methylation domain-containing protein [Candidatus Omnitrophica bacterium]|nr:prepilin-type N-terminal cleavage/methylation domain-containing protein [Candidatus Omnitrophota bacterium]